MSGSEDAGRYRTRVGHCKQDETDVYAGRGPNGRDMFSVAKPGGRGWLGNPFPLADGITREESVESFRQAFEDKLERDAEFREAVGDLAGKTLGCWCQRLGEDEPACHAEIIAEHAVRIARQRDTGIDREEGSDHD
jgi:hypothetical protein